MKNKIYVIMLTVLIITGLYGCAQNNQNKKSDSETISANEVQSSETMDTTKLNVITTIFPYYDFVKQIAGDKVNFTMLVPAGMDTHSFEPTPANMIEIENADVFIYNGGEMESWVSQILDAVENPDQISVRMMDYVETVVEEEKEGMEAEEEEEELGELEYDEHIWTSPVNAVKIVKQISETLKEADPDNAVYYQANADNYINQLKELDAKFQEVVSNSKHKIMIVGDKFPLRYFVDQYGLDYSAAFKGCSTETEPSADTIAYLINKTEEEQVGYIYQMELNNGKIAQTISEATSTKVLQFQSCHNVTKESFEKGVTYLELMKQNVEVLKEGLN
jgi:zinc transport system substrate-binding protein